ncbi:hypothetical protein [Sphingomonas lenta]|uniref:Pectate lyase superfamily protein domain-containing protein n=1 Tax=Sphingomonas lenta TaxID=1141887 RepID=A0A2A2SIH3_9SPHN|nr:hypothetical protein [Sphingomonas lenta]PAX09077.1 hypothetical protein CKY28_07055 [Sphingomonas lenta]
MQKGSAALLAAVSMAGVAYAAATVFDDSNDAMASDAVVVVPSATQPAIAGSASSFEVAAAAWRSALYPTDWLPLHAGGAATSDGKFLHDFSYAGYLEGSVPIPTTVGANAVRTLAASTWGNGTSDATTGIQQAIDQVCAGGGGTVNLGAGTYRIRPQGSNDYALRMPCRDLIVRGAVDSAGLPATFLFNDEPVMRGKRVIVMGESTRGIYATLFDKPGNVANNKVAITQDLLRPTRTIPVASTTGYSPGDYVAITFDWSDAFKADHGMQQYWPVEKVQGMLFYRRVLSADATAKTVTVDIPLRYPVKLRDNPRMYEPRAYFANLGLENVSIGMRENNTSGTGDNDVYTAGTGAWEMDQATAVQVVLARHSWIRNVRSHRPSVNARDVHLLSNGIHITASTRSLTVQNVHLAKPQYRGFNGNGYLIYLDGAETLVRDSSATAGRHNFLWTGASTSGNVIYMTRSINGRLEDDFHGYLSPANLVDNHYLQNTRLNSINRQADSNGAGHTSSQSVFWNTRGNPEWTLTYIRSQQFGWGYVIGTQGRGTGGVDATGDHVEGLGIGADLQPQSLYLDQKAKRDANPNY